MAIRNSHSKNFLTNEFLKIEKAHFKESCELKAYNFPKNKVLNSYFSSILLSTYGIYGFIHAHEQVYFPLLSLIWKDEELYANVIPILGGF